MGFIHFDSLSSPQLKGGKQSNIGMKQISRHQPIYVPTLLLLLVFNTGLEIYIISHLHPSSIWSFVIGIFWVPIPLKAK